MSRILIVEDHDLSRELLVQLLIERYEVDVASNGAEALKHVDASPPDLILLDLTLPVLDGWSVARRLKTQTSTRTIPILALTAHAMAGDRESAIEAGCDDYMAKPIDEERLFALIDFFLRRPRTPASDVAPPASPAPDPR